MKVMTIHKRRNTKTRTSTSLEINETENKIVRQHFS